MKRFGKFITGLALISSLLFVTGCSNDSKKDESSKNKEGKTELAVSVWAYDANPEFKAMFEAFEAENKEVKIKVVDIAADQYEDKVTTMLAGGDTTDVLAMKGVGSYMNYANKGQLLDLSESVAKLSAEDLENFSGNLEGYELENGTYYAMPFRKDIYMLFYNKKIFDDNNEPYPENLTWDEYESLAERLTSGKNDSKVYGAYHHTWNQMVQATAANQTQNDQLDGKYDFFEEYYDRYIRMQDKDITMDYATVKTTSTTYASMFETEKTAMMIQGSFYLGKLLTLENNDELDLDWAVSSMPQRKKGSVTTYGGPTGFAVSKHSKNQELAQKLVEFCAGPKGAMAVANIGMTTAYKSPEVMEALYAVNGMPADEESKRALNPDVNGWELLPRDSAATVAQILSEEHDLIMVEDISVKNGLKEMEKRFATEVE